MQFIWRFHNWYDRQPEPQRFLLMLLLASPIIATGLWVDTSAKAFGAVVYLSLLLGPRMYRAYSKEKL